MTKPVIEYRNPDVRPATIGAIGDPYADQARVYAFKAIGVLVAAGMLSAGLLLLMATVFA